MEGGEGGGEENKGEKGGDGLAREEGEEIRWGGGAGHGRWWEGEEERPEGKSIHSMPQGSSGWETSIDSTRWEGAAGR